MNECASLPAPSYHPLPAGLLLPTSWAVPLPSRPLCEAWTEELPASGPRGCLHKASGTCMHSSLGRLPFEHLLCALPSGGTAVPFLSTPVRRAGSKMYLHG